MDSATCSRLATPRPGAQGLASEGAFYIIFTGKTPESSRTVLSNFEPFQFHYDNYTLEPFLKQILYAPHIIVLLFILI